MELDTFQEVQLSLGLDNLLSVSLCNNSSVIVALITKHYPWPAECIKIPQISQRLSATVFYMLLIVHLNIFMTREFP